MIGKPCNFKGTSYSNNTKGICVMNQKLELFGHDVQSDKKFQRAALTKTCLNIDQFGKDDIHDIKQLLNTHDFYSYFYGR